MKFLNDYLKLYYATLMENAIDFKTLGTIVNHNLILYKHIIFNILWCEIIIKSYRYLLKMYNTI